jgi:UDP-galactose transporter
MCGTRAVRAACIISFISLSTATVFAVRASQTHAAAPCSTSLVLLLIDAGKLLVCFTLRSLLKEGTKDPCFDFVLCIPSFLYTWQTQLLLYASGFLDATTYQLLGQFKIFSATIFSRTLLQKSFETRHYISLAILAAGTCLATAGPLADNAEINALAVVAMLCAGMTSGFAGVWTEKSLKSRPFLTANIQLSFPSLILAAVQVYLYDALFSRRYVDHGLWHGFNQYTALVVGLQIVTGLLIGVLLKHTDSLVKNFAVSISLLLTYSIDAVLNNRCVDIKLHAAMTLVVFSLLLYANCNICLALASSIATNFVMSTISWQLRT